MSNDIEKNNDDNNNKNIDDTNNERREFIKKISALSLTGLILPFCGDDKKKKDDPYKDIDTAGDKKNKVSNSENKKDKPKIEVKDDKEKKDDKVPGKETERGVMKYKELGNTGLMVSDISVGAGGLTNHRVALKALETGMNYFDTAPDYMSGVSETTLGKAFKASSLTRDKYVVTSKMCLKGPYPKHLYNASVKTIIQKVEDSLKRMNIDYIDFLLVHALAGIYDRAKFEENKKKGKINYDSHSPDVRIYDDRIWEAVRKLKEQGKIKYSGLSSHGGSNFPENINNAIDTGQIELIMAAYSMNNSKRKELEKVFAKAEKKGIALVGMKVLRGGGGRSKCIKFVNSSPYVDTMVVTIKSNSDVKRFSKLSGQKLTQAEYNRYLKHANYVTGECHVGCEECLDACPYGVAINDVLRYNYYFEIQGSEKEAMVRYANLKRSQQAERCMSCPGHCKGACSYGVDIKSQLQAAHSNLSLHTV